MHVRIHSISRTLFEGDAASLTAPTLSGEITVLPHHRPLLSELKEGMIRIVDTKGGESFVPVLSGFIEVKDDDTISVLADEIKE
jgi:F-type H+-transporting ATPase subunit epsilon